MRGYDDGEGISLLYDLLNVMEQDVISGAMPPDALYTSTILDFINDILNDVRDTGVGYFYKYYIVSEL